MPASTANRVPPAGAVVVASSSSVAPAVDMMNRQQRNARRKDIQKKLDKWDKKQHGYVHRRQFLLYRRRRHRSKRGLSCAFFQSLCFAVILQSNHLRTTYHLRTLAMVYASQYPWWKFTCPAMLTVDTHPLRIPIMR